MTIIYEILVCKIVFFVRAFFTVPIFPEFFQMINRYAGCYRDVSKWRKTNALHAVCYCDA